VSFHTGGTLKKRIIMLIFSVYLFAVLWITLIDRESGRQRAMLTPFWELASVLKGQERGFYIRQIAGNLAMLMPMGFMMPIIVKKDIRIVTATAFMFSLAIEITQYVTGRGLMEFDDLFHNTIGAVMGYALYKYIVEKGFGNEEV